jgi:hypothetical protein
MSDLVVSVATGTVRAEIEESRSVLAEETVGAVTHTEMEGMEFRGTPFGGDNTVAVVES